MIRKDFHGWTINATSREIDRIVGDVRLNNKQETCEFITGRGVIRELLMQQIREYNLHPELKLGNDGVIVVIVE